MKKYFFKEKDNLRRIYTWATEQISKGTTHDFLINLNYALSPKVQLLGKGYREVNMKIEGYKRKPSKPNEILTQMEKYVSNFSNLKFSSDKFELINSAISSNLNLLRIHPFDDGNGRTARFIELIILDKSGIPLPLFDPKENEFYFRLLENAFLKNSNFNPTPKTNQEKELYAYMFNKVNESINKVLNASRGMKR